MFSWICPGCGKELDIATGECPQCGGRPGAKAPGRGPVSGNRFWLLLAAGALAGVAALVFGVRYYQSRPRAAPPIEITASEPPQQLPAPAPVREPSSAPQPSRPWFANQLEIAGIRTAYDSKDKPQVRAVLINHGEEPLAGINFSVALRPLAAGAGTQPLARFQASIGAEIKPGESREIRAPLEALGTLASLPPWRQLRADIE